jgi:hypothetical protein
MGRRGDPAFLFGGKTMMRSRSSWRRLAALAAIGWVTAGLPAQAQNAPSTTGGTSRPNHLTSEARAGSTLSQPALASNDASPVKVVAATARPATSAADPAAKPPVTPAAATQRTTYQQAHGTEIEPAPAPTNPPANRLFSQYETANRAYVAEPLAPAIVPETVAAGDGAYSNCGPQGGCDQGGCNPCRCQQCCSPFFYNNGWYVGGEYLYLRPNFSSPVAAVEQTTIIDPNTNASVITDRVLDYNIDYDSTFRLFGGYRWGDCGESIELSYWQIDTGESFTSDPATQSLFFAGFGQTLADAPGEILQTHFDVELDVFDIDYTKRMPVQKGGPSGSGQCCPAWDWAWSLGARIADFERNHVGSVIDGNGVLLTAAEAETRFTGAGPRAGIEGRRYFGEGRKWSAYGTSNWSLLLGDYEVSATRTAGLTTSIRIQDFIRTVPVMELEVGLSRQIGCRTHLTAGYQFQAWWEIGSFDSVMVGDCECITSSNILSFDGLFVRLEHTFGAHSRKKCQ